ncbi:MAG: M3 family metallopeptidase, partial [Bacteroidota bacterium]
MSQENNPLLAQFDTPFATPPFDQVKASHFMPAIDISIKKAEEEINVIATNKAAPDYTNTIEALEFCGEKLGTINSILFNLNSAETSDELQEIVKEASPKLSKYSNQIYQNAELFSRVKQVFEQKDNLSLSGEQTILLENTYKAFVRNGANLSDEEKQRYQTMSMEVSKLKLQFGENVLAETNEYEMVIDDAADLSGIPELAIGQARQLAEQKGAGEKWIFTLQAPSYIPFMENADNRKLRETLYKAYTGRANKGDEKDNKEIVRKIVSIRAEMANMLGYDNYAAYVLEERMAGSSQQV